MITISYDTPVNGQTELSGTYSLGSETRNFSCKITYTDGEIDLPATEEFIRTCAQTLFDDEASIGE